MEKIHIQDKEKRSVFDFKNSNSQEVESLFQGDFENALGILCESIFGFQKYDSIDSYNILFDGYSDEEIRTSAVEIISGWDPTKQLEKKYGQDCYDIMFKLLNVLPKSLSPQILATRNVEHTEREQSQKFKYFHFSVIVTNPTNGDRYLLDWTNKPIKLIEGFNVETKSGDKLTVNVIDNEKIGLVRNLVKREVLKPIDYEYIPSNFDIAENFRNFLRIENRNNIITKRSRETGEVSFLKFKKDMQGFETNIDGLDGFIKVDYLMKNKIKIEEVFEVGVINKLLNFVRIHNILPESFWI